MLSTPLAKSCYFTLVTIWSMRFLQSAMLAVTCLYFYLKRLSFLILILVDQSLISISETIIFNHIQISQNLQLTGFWGFGVLLFFSVI